MRFDGASVSVHVASHTNALPYLKGKTVIPSGWWPSPRSRPTGSKTEWKPAASNARFVMSLMAACRGTCLHYADMTTDVGHRGEQKNRTCNDVDDTQLGRGEGQPKYVVRRR